VIAHRGGRQPGVRENSIAALEGAIAAGADFVEFDVRRTIDGALVINHDQRLDGVSIARAPLERLRALAHPPALLEDVVARVGGRIGMDVELKEAGYEAEVLAALDPVLHDGPPVFLSSFIEQAVAAVRRLAPDVSAVCCCATPVACSARRQRATRPWSCRGGVSTARRSAPAWRAPGCPRRRGRWTTRARSQRGCAIPASRA